MSDAEKAVGELLLNIVGGVIVAVLTALYLRTIPRFSRWRLMRVFGEAVVPKDTIYVIPAYFILPEKYGQYPYVKPSRKHREERPGGGFSLQNPVSSCDVRAASYFATAFGALRMSPPHLISDLAADSLVNVTFVSFGGPGSNYKTEDLLGRDENVFVMLGNEGFLTKSGHRIHLPDQNHDYGFILRIRNTDFPTRVWICCVGLGEWATSGTAWYLANKWRLLLRRSLPWYNRLGLGGIPDFFALIKVTPGQDESATLVAFCKSADEMEALAANS